MTCCGRRAEDHTVDVEEIDRAVAGRDATLTPTELRLAIWQMSVKRGWGLTRISQQLSFSRSKVGEILAEQRKANRP